MNSWLNDLVETEALLHGHFLLASGLHSDRYVLLARLVARPARLAPWIRTLAQFARDCRPEAVVGPAVGGIILSWAVAQALGGEVWAAFAEKDPSGAMVLRRGFSLKPGTRIFLVEDALTTGGSLLKTEAALQAHGGVVVGAGALVDRRPAGTTLPWPFAAVTRVEARTWAPEDCPLCAAGDHPVKPKMAL
jgi:orotate phosphoribosyltransferase